MYIADYANVYYVTVVQRRIDNIKLNIGYYGVNQTLGL